MPMPKATIYKNHYLIFGKNNIWLSWKPDIIFSIAESFRKKILSDQLLWLSVLTPYPRHIIASSFC